MGGNAKMFRTFCWALFLISLLVACHQEKVVPPKPPQEAAPPAKVEPPPQKPQEEPDTEFKKLHYVIYEKGKLKWNIRAQEAYIFKGKRIKMKDLKVCAHPDKGFCITAEEGDYDPKAGRFLFRGKVILDAGRRGKLFTSVLKYLPQKESLETEAAVVIKNEGFLIKGKGFRYDLKSGAMKVLKRTKVRVDA
ncbi:MAG TPA: LPS export ABC transporter periplasmic protein LptC [Thermodesulfatator atlanticus]|uniref:LPS export ABC transporter periplasmic protein LptC n=1 Tax=Thermodesulfatator atlanticus TaxID=501497 RepID=A0A7V5NYS7_9BACT|nr:LPS export ABC transporter periplasmic protein LptC [Thermodesulfatator atlanticus]